VLPIGPMSRQGREADRRGLEILWPLASLLWIGLWGGWAGLLLPQRYPAGFLAPSPVPTPSADQVNAVARQLYCPVCANVPLDVCSTQACEQWRAIIREELSQGWSAQQIKDYFVQEYGERVLASPPAQGLNLLMYLLPPLAFVLGAYFLYRAVHTWRGGPGGAGSAPSAPAEDEYARRLEDQLRRKG